MDKSRLNNVKTNKTYTDRVNSNQKQTIEFTGGAPTVLTLGPNKLQVRDDHAPVQGQVLQALSETEVGWGDFIPEFEIIQMPVYQTAKSTKVEVPQRLHIDSRGLSSVSEFVESIWKKQKFDDFSSEIEIDNKNSQTYLKVVETIGYLHLDLSQIKIKKDIKQFFVSIEGSVDADLPDFPQSSFKFSGIGHLKLDSELILCHLHLEKEILWITTDQVLKADSVYDLHGSVIFIF